MLSVRLKGLSLKDNPLSKISTSAETRSDEASQILGENSRVMELQGPGEGSGLLARCCALIRASRLACVMDGN